MGTATEEEAAWTKSETCACSCGGTAGSYGAAHTLVLFALSQPSASHPRYMFDTFPQVEQTRPWSYPNPHGRRLVDYPHRISPRQNYSVSDDKPSLPYRRSSFWFVPLCFRLLFSFAPADCLCFTNTDRFRLAIASRLLTSASVPFVTTFALRRSISFSFVGFPKVRTCFVIGSDL